MTPTVRREGQEQRTREVLDLDGAIHDEGRDRQGGIVQLLNLDQLDSVPKTWKQNYDYFWVIDYDPDHSQIPVHFKMIKQIYPSPFNSLPHNAWGQALPKNYPTTCLR